MFRGGLLYTGGGLSWALCSSHYCLPSALCSLPIVLFRLLSIPTGSIRSVLASDPTFASLCSMFHAGPRLTRASFKLSLSFSAFPVLNCRMVLVLLGFVVFAVPASSSSLYLYPLPLSFCLPSYTSLLLFLVLLLKKLENWPPLLHSPLYYSADSRFRSTRD